MKTSYSSQKERTRFLVYPLKQHKEHSLSNTNQKNKFFCREALQYDNTIPNQTIIRMCLPCQQNFSIKPYLGRIITPWKRNLTNDQAACKKATYKKKNPHGRSTIPTFCPNHKHCSLLNILQTWHPAPWSIFKVISQPNMIVR